MLHHTRNFDADYKRGWLDGASDILTTAVIASVGLLHPLFGFQAAHNGNWVRLPLNKPFKG
jgi:hypothetical protein